MGHPELDLALSTQQDVVEPRDRAIAVADVIGDDYFCRPARIVGVDH